MKIKSLSLGWMCTMAVLAGQMALAQLPMTYSPNPVRVQIGDQVDVVVTRPTNFRQQTFEFFSSDPSLFTVEPAQVVFAPDVSTGTVTIRGIATSAGLMEQNAEMTVREVATGNFRNPLQVTVFTGNQLLITPDPVEVTAGNTRTVTVTRDGATGSALAVSLAIDDEGIASVPETMTIPAGSATGTFTLSGVNPGTTEVRVSASGYPAASANVNVAAFPDDPDDPTDQITISPTPVRLQVGRTQNIQVSRPANQSGATLTLNLRSSDTSRFTVPATLTFAAGQSSVSVPVTGVAQTALPDHATLTVGVGTQLARTVQVLVFDSTSELQFVSWRDVNGSGQYSAGDMVYLTFSSAMNPATVTLANLELFGAGASWGAGASVQTVADTDQRIFVITLGSGASLDASKSVKPTVRVLDSFGAPDATPEPIPFPATEDSDNDGLPDWWEILYFRHLDYGPYDDPDNDGLHNLAEYWAGTDPTVFDTAGDGFSDYDSRPAPGELTWGERFTDNDGMDDLWEVRYPGVVSPLRYDAHEDPDGDGWSNFAEFMWRSNPGDPSDFPRPSMQAWINYNGVRTDGQLLIHFYDNPNMDGRPLSTVTPRGILEAERVGIGDVTVTEPTIIAASGATGSAVLTPRTYSVSGTLPLTPVIPGSALIQDGPLGSIRLIDQGNGVLLSSGITPQIVGSINYESGAWQADLEQQEPIGAFRAEWRYETELRTYPQNVTMTPILREGEVWAFAFIDLDGSGDWSPGEPAGLAEQQPINVSWGRIPNVRFGLTDTKPGYPRVAWPANGRDENLVQIVRLSSPGAPEIFSQTIRGRNYIHEGDFIRRGILGLDAGGSVRPEFELYVNGVPVGLDEDTNNDANGEVDVMSGRFTMDWSASLSQPVAVEPAGLIQLARNDFVWQMPAQTVSVRLQVRSGSATGQIVYDEVIPAPYRDRSGVARYAFPLLAGDSALPNGNYVWRVQARNPRHVSSWSSYRSFTVSLTDTAPQAHSIAGRVHYFGQASANRIVVQAYESPGFSGHPAAQVTLNGPGAYNLRGLRPGTYHIRAFIDSVGDSQPRVWSSTGYLLDYPSGNPHGIRPVRVPGNQRQQDLVIRDRDINNNRIPDAVEYVQSGALGADSQNLTQYLQGLGLLSGEQFLSTRRPRLSWSSVSGATWYRAWLSQNGQAFASQWLQGVTQWTAGEVNGLPGGRYEFWVQPWGPSIGFGSWRMIDSFDIATRAPGLVALTGPIGMQSGRTLTYRWQKDPNASWYRLWVNRVNVGVWHDQWHASEGGGTASVTLSGHDIGSHEWWIQPWGPDGFGRWSGPLTFQVP